VTRIARIVVLGAAHHFTQRGNRRKRVFFEDATRARFETGKTGVSP
jgi:REP element-mobilizing transposase RayT